MSVTIEGDLVRPGEKRTEVLNHHAVVVLMVHVGPGYHAEARLMFKGDHRKADAVALAARRGSIARIEAEGFFPRTDHSTSAVVLTNVTWAMLDGSPVYP